MLASDASPGPRPKAWNEPFVWLATGAAGAWLALGGLAVFGPEGAALRVGLVFLSLLAAGWGIVLRPSSPAVLAAAAGVGLFSWLALAPWEGREVPWDSARYLVAFLTGVTVAAAVLFLLPRVVRRVAVSLVIVFHFLGILSAVFSVPPAPWLATNLWAYVFRPYLEFMYLNNAYHFYSPDPGPPNLLWFRLEYEDGSLRWYKMPNREDYPTAVNYQRRLSMTESAHHAMVTPADAMLRRQQRRASVEGKYPAHPTVPVAAQFREPNTFAKKMIQNYTRHVAQVHSAPHPGAPGKVVKVRLYRVIHEILEARALANGDHPLDLYTYRPYYQGEFDAEGNLLNPNDPMLYWLVPIIRKDDRLGWVQGDPAALVRVSAGGREYEVYDYLKVHAGNYE